jgi:16S rRNA (cytidine1402-2'-O)-methyltransferase
MKNLDEHTQENEKEGSGLLYVVSTPLGNLEDITLRALKILKSVDTIAAESVNRTKGFCNHYGIRTKIVRYNQHNRKQRTPELLGYLRSGKNLALVTDAGTPGISDPGINLVDMALKEEIRVSPIPGPSAVSAALSVSGMPGEEFVFLGFLPSKAGKRKSSLKKLTLEPRTMVFFEAPHRLKSMLKDIETILGDRQVVLLREMTKVFEEVRNGTAGEILNHFAGGEIKGECTLVVSGKTGENNDRKLSEEAQKKIKNLLLKEKMSLKDISNLILKEEKLSYRQIYKECLACKRDINGTLNNGTGTEIKNKK